MFVYPTARRTGKTYSIIEQVNWCVLFDMLPICIIVRDELARNYMETRLMELDLTENERNLIKIIPAGLHSHPGAVSIGNVLNKLSGIQFQRIYIDDVTDLSKELVDRLRTMYDNVMHVYGTIDIETWDEDRRFKFNEMQCGDKL